jgi:hypothetical protein
VKGLSEQAREWREAAEVARARGDGYAAARATLNAESCERRIAAESSPARGQVPAAGARNRG